MTLYEPSLDFLEVKFEKNWELRQENSIGGWQMKDQEQWPMFLYLNGKELVILPSNYYKKGKILANCFFHLNFIGESQQESGM